MQGFKMSLIKVAFLGIHNRELGPKERESYIKKYNEYNEKYFKHPVAKTLKVGGIGALYGGVGYLSAHAMGKSPKVKALATTIAALAGAAQGYGLNHLDIKSNERKIEKLKEPGRKWIVFGKKSNLDNE